MAKGDWAPGTGLRLTQVNISFDPANPTKIAYVGIGYEVILPSGDVAKYSGFAWHSPGNGQVAPGLPAVQAIVDQIVAAALAHEGVSTVVEARFQGA